MKKLLLLLSLLAIASSASAGTPLLSMDRVAFGVRGGLQTYAPSHTYITSPQVAGYLSYTTSTQTSVFCTYEKAPFEAAPYGRFLAGANLSLYGFEAGSRGPQVGVGVEAVHYDNLDSLYSEYPWSLRVALKASYGLIKDGGGKTVVYLAGQAGLDPKSNVPDFGLWLNVPIKK